MAGRLHSQGLSEQKPINNFVEKSAGVSRGCPSVLSAPYISGTGKDTDFKSGRYIYRVHSNNNPLKSFEKRGRRRIQGLPNVTRVSLSPDKIPGLIISEDSEEVATQIAKNCRR